MASIKLTDLLYKTLLFCGILRVIIISVSKRFPNWGAGRSRC